MLCQGEAIVQNWANDWFHKTISLLLEQKPNIFSRLQDIFKSRLPPTFSSHRTPFYHRWTILGTHCPRPGWAVLSPDWLFTQLAFFQPFNLSRKISQGGLPWLAYLVCYLHHPPPHICTHPNHFIIPIATSFLSVVTLRNPFISIWFLIYLGVTSLEHKLHGSRNVPYS